MIKRLLVALLPGLMLQPALAQENTVKKERLRDFYIAPSVGYELFSVKNYTENTNGFFLEYKQMPSLRLGFDVLYKYNDKLALNTGLFFATKNFERTEYCSECNTVYFYKSKLKNKFLETHIGLTYNFVTGRVDLGAYINANIAYMLKAEEIRDTQTGNQFEFNMKPNSNSWLAIAEPGLAFNYNLTYRLSLNLKAGYRLYLNRIPAEKTFTHNAVLVQPGLMYKF